MTQVEEKIKEHEKLVYFMINKMFKSQSNLEYTASSRGFQKEDIYQVGMIGLWKAVKTFNESKGRKFSTYATRCIRNEIHNEIIIKRYMNDTPMDLDEHSRVKLTIAKDIDDVKVKKYERSTKFDSDVVHKLLFKKHINKLSDKELTIVDMKMKGYTQDEIAEKFGCSRQNIGVMSKKMKEKMYLLRYQIG